MAGGIPTGFQPLGCRGDGAQGGRESGGADGFGLWTDDGHVLNFYNETGADASGIFRGNYKGINKLFRPLSAIQASFCVVNLLKGNERNDDRRTDREVDRKT
jgi:hypothetical protein